MEDQRKQPPNTPSKTTPPLPPITPPKIDNVSQPSKTTPSPSSSTIISDRFIPSRTSSNFALFNLSPFPSDDSLSDSSKAYTAVLRSALFGPDYAAISPSTPAKSCGGIRNRNIFRYKTETKRKLCTGGLDDFVPGFQFKRPRKISESPFKVLDAPGLEDDFYLNLVDWSPNNVVALGLKNDVYLWDANNSQVNKLCELESDDVCSVSWAQSGTQIAVGTSSGKVMIWDAYQCKRVRTLEGHRSRVGALAWSSYMLSSGSRDKIILQRDLRSKDNFVTKLSGHTSEVCGLKWSSDNRELASGGNDNKLFIWNQHSNKPIFKYNEHTAAVKAIAWSPHVRGLLASGGGTGDRHIRFWNTTTNTHLSSVDTDSQVCNLAWSKNVNEIVSTHGFSENQIIVWRYPSMSKLATLRGHTYRVLYLALSPDGERIVTGAGGEDETLRFWNVFPSPKSENSRCCTGILSLGRTVIR